MLFSKPWNWFVREMVATWLIRNLQINRIYVLLSGRRIFAALSFFVFDAEEDLWRDCCSNLFLKRKIYEEIVAVIYSWKDRRFHWVKGVRIRSFSGPNAGRYGPEKLQIRILFKQWSTNCLRVDCDVYLLSFLRKLKCE